LPELPEVETTRRHLEPAIVGRKIAAVAIHPGAERLAITHSPRQLEAELTGRTIEALTRHGKYLLARLDDGRTWVIHLRMSGSLVVTPAASGTPPHPYERARVTFEDGTVLRFNDLRKFGTWHLVEHPADAMPNAGPDALSDDFSVAWLRDQLGRRTIAVKSALLDQKIAAGVGNIYADEACYIAGVDPRASAGSLGPRRVRRLHDAVIEALQRSLEDGGTTFSNYLDGNGNEGLHRIRVHVFRRDGEPCDRCGTTIRKVRLGGRGTHFCPHCQRR
jgi:formamidopyrimidine-DNA glycosylase